jgi:chromosome segregation ATPase
LGTLTESGRWVPINSGRFSAALEAVESAELEQLIDEREQLREQLKHVRDLSTRLMDRVDAQEQRIASLEGHLKKKQTLIHDLEAEAAQLIAHASSREERVQALKNQLDELESSNDELVMQASRREERIAQLQDFLKLIGEREE